MAIWVGRGEDCSSLGGEWAGSGGNPTATCVGSPASLTPAFIASAHTHSDDALSPSPIGRYRSRAQFYRRGHHLSTCHSDGPPPPSSSSSFRSGLKHGFSHPNLRLMAYQVVLKHKRQITKVGTLKKCSQGWQF